MRSGVRLGVDVGVARLGIAMCDAEGLLATPLETVKCDSSGETGLSRVVDLAQHFQPLEIIVGLPLSLDGSSGHAALLAREFARRLTHLVTPIVVRLIDERMSTVVAHQALRDSGRKMVDHRRVVDQAAAVEILQTALDIERNTGRMPGEQVSARKPRRSKGLPS